MKVKELIAQLSTLPEDAEVWVSDRGYCEGAEPLTSVKLADAHLAGLDGDSVDDEYLYVEEDTDLGKYLAEGYLMSTDGSVLYKKIALLHDN